VYRLSKSRSPHRATGGQGERGPQRDGSPLRVVIHSLITSGFDISWVPVVDISASASGAGSISRTASQ
jgi:hypothetical protein